MHKERLDYIDALRGFTMILVVFAHVETFILSIEVHETFLGSLFQSFRMPLFFFISGFLSYKIDKSWDLVIWKHYMFRRIRFQIIPTLICGAIYTYCLLKVNIVDFISDYYKLGYWFTICLFGMLFILHTTNLVLYKFSISKKKYVIFILFTITCLLYILRCVFERSPEFARLSNVFCFHQISLYFPFFILGYISSLCRTTFYKFMDNNIIQSIVLVSFCFLFYFKVTSYSSLCQVSNFLMLLYRKIQVLIIPLFGIFIVFNLFRKKHIYFTKDTYIVKKLKYIGKHTLEIYLLHYFFLSPIPKIGSFILKYPNLILELFIGLSVSLLVIVACMVISNLVKTNPILGRCLLGSK